MKISVIAIFYNSSEYVRKCVDSILGQTYTDLELIAVDDCSRDNTVEILNEYAAQDARVRVVCHSENRGIAAARNTGLDNVQGDCFYLIDGDDWLPLDALENLAPYFRDGVDWVSGGYDIVDEEDNVIRCRSKQDGDYKSREEIQQNFSNVEFIWLHNRLIHKKYSSIKFIEGILHEDQFWNLDIYKSLNHIVNRNVSTYKYVERQTSFSSGSRFKQRFIDDGLKLIKEMYANDHNWKASAEAMAVSTIVKNIYLGDYSAAYRTKIVREIRECGIYPITHIDISGYPRFAILMYRVMKYPDWVRNIIAKSYLTFSKIVGRKI